MEASNPSTLPRKKAKDGVKKTGKKTGKKTSGKKEPTSTASAVPVATPHPVGSQYAPTYTPIPQTQTVVFEKPGRRADSSYNDYNITTIRLMVLRSSQPKKKGVDMLTRVFGSFLLSGGHRSGS